MRLLAAQWISSFGDYLAPVALAFAVLNLTNSVTDLGITLFARTAPMVALMLVGGVWADRLPRHRVMLAAHLVRFASQGLLAALLVTGNATLTAIACTQAVNGSATAFFRPAISGLLPEISPPAALQSVNALNSLALSSAGVLGPAAAGAVVAFTQPGWAIFADASTFAIAAVLLATLRIPPRQPRVHDRFVQELRHGWHIVHRSGWLWKSIVVFAIFQLTVQATFVILGPAIARQSLGGAAAWGAIVSAWSAGFVLGGFIALRIRSQRPLLVNSVLLSASVPSLTLLALVMPAPVLIATELFAGTALGVSDTLWQTSLQRYTPASARSRIAAYDWMGSTALRPLGLVAVGPLASLIGPRSALIGAASLLALGTAWLLLDPTIRVGQPGQPPEEEPSGRMALQRLPGRS